ncbi:hypothetical protein [Polyangium sorediatum]|uniref:Phage holin family protein n=1 Tax=Polyangium sorediatum TaxID=889274 RepID=A0ABT6P9W0_9BACT|nr:hypothetical protein [Polyangium sorediatum]MDI1437057.1 hypothetical protein [Polyangium sorediatum]
MGNNDDLARLGIFTESRLDVSVSANIVHITPEAAMAQIQVAKAQVDIAKSRYEMPVRITMQYLLAAIVALLIFVVVVLVLSKVLGLDSNLTIAVVFVVGAAVAAPIGIVLTKIVNRVFPSPTSESEQADKKD